MLKKHGFTFDQLKEHTEKIRKEWISDKSIIKELHNRSLLNKRNQPSEAIQKAYNNLVNGHWIIFKSPLNYPFITSDNPGYSLDQQNLIHNTKFDNNVCFFFPLNSYNVLTILIDSNNPPIGSVKQIGIYQAERFWVDTINRNCWHFAHKEVYAAHESTLERVWRAEKLNS